MLCRFFPPTYRSRWRWSVKTWPGVSKFLFLGCGIQGISFVTFVDCHPTFAGISARFQYCIRVNWRRSTVRFCIKVKKFFEGIKSTTLELILLIDTSVLGLALCKCSQHYSVFSWSVTQNEQMFSLQGDLIHPSVRLNFGQLQNQMVHL